MQTSIATGSRTQWITARSRRTRRSRIATAIAAAMRAKATAAILGSAAAVRTPRRSRRANSAGRTRTTTIGATPHTAFGGSLTATTTCLSFTSVAGPGGCCTGPGLSFSDADDNGVPDYLLNGGAVTRDHRGDANGDGYSDADEGTPANCGVASCASVTSHGTAETASCLDAGRNCGTVAISPVRAPRVLRAAPDSAAGAASIRPGRWLRRGWRSPTSTSMASCRCSTWRLPARGSAIRWLRGDDPRWEGNLDGDGFVSILDLALIASNYGRSVSLDCQVA